MRKGLHFLGLQLSSYASDILSDRHDGGEEAVQDEAVRFVSEWAVRAAKFFHLIRDSSIV